MSELHPLADALPRETIQSPEEWGGPTFDEAVQLLRRATHPRAAVPFDHPVCTAASLLLLVGGVLVVCFSMLQPPPRPLPSDWRAIWPPATPPVPPPSSPLVPPQADLSQAQRAATHDPPPSAPLPVPVGSSHFITSERATRSFGWSAPARSVQQAFDDAPGGVQRWAYNEEGAPRQLTRESVVHWVEHELLSGTDPFAATGGKVPVPWPQKESFCNGDGRGCARDEHDDQLGEGEWVGYSRRQLCYIVARSLVGSTTMGYRNGLFRFLHRQTAAGCSARTGDFGRSFVSLLAACAADPTLAHGRQGPMLLVAKASRPPPMAALRAAAANATLAAAGLRFCEYDAADAPLPDVHRVPSKGCDPSASRDFMSGGPLRLEGQAIVDISAKFVGGYIFGNVCGLGGGQDERLMVYMPEVAALAFFLSAASPRPAIGERPQLRVPVWVVGARMLFLGLDGTARHDRSMRHDADVPFARRLLHVSLGGEQFDLDDSRPFVAFMSETQGFLGEPEEAHGADVRLARRNRHVAQRETDASRWFAFEYQVRAWYTAVAVQSYHPAVRGAMRRLVRSVGSGPWMAGLWWGDSQVALLATWLGHSLVQRSWRVQPGEASDAAALPLDYYIYSTFTENPANQCFLLPREYCVACLRRCMANPLPASAYWLPSWALFRDGNAKSCAGFESDCGVVGVDQIVTRYQPKTALELWEAAEAAMKESVRNGSTSSDVFTALAAIMSS